MDLNADAGESQETSLDEELLAFVTSVNLACGVHAGSPATIARLSEAAAARGVGVGAHPGLAGSRTARPIAAVEARDAVLRQVDLFRQAARAPLQHVKLHGALYHAARDPRTAAAVVEAMKEIGSPILIAQAGSPLEKAGLEAGLPVAAEAFLDRAYLPDGLLVPRDRPGALLESPELVAARALDLVLRRRVIAVDGTAVGVEARTLCVHSDTPGALGLAAAARRALEDAGVALRPLGRG